MIKKKIKILEDKGYYFDLNHLKIDTREIKKFNMNSKLIK
jgi:hypothetical protein